MVQRHVGESPDHFLVFGTGQRPNEGSCGPESVSADTGMYVLVQPSWFVVISKSVCAEL